MSSDKKGCGTFIPVDPSDKNSEGWQCGQFYDALKTNVYCEDCMMKKDNKGSDKQHCTNECNKFGRCKICFRKLSDRGKPNKRGLCSGCANDCLQGQWGRIGKNIDNMLKQVKKLEDLK